ncbi:hypothetical protein EDB83DRAFT_2316469 [Lactarius deliciosus]|nr:hypothetical protein EDB83DRAFT_2316469 [Lactarius deliciosus]
MPALLSSPPSALKGDINWGRHYPIENFNREYRQAWTLYYGYHTSANVPTSANSERSCEIIQYNEDQSKITVGKNRQRRWGGPENKGNQGGDKIPQGPWRGDTT